MDPTKHNFDLDFELERPTQTPRPGATQAVTRGVTVTKWTLGGVVALGVVALLLAVDVLALGSAQAKPRPTINVVRLSDATPVASTVYLSVAPGIKPGPDGQLHDAFSITNFNVHAGQPVKLVINNTDSVPHSINSPGAGVNIVAKPGVHTYTLLVPNSGKFLWMCTYPCDPYSMAHVGYMRGYITSV